MSEDIIYLPDAVIDTHCHGRDMFQAEKTTVEQTLFEARNGNIATTFLMPNTDPPIIDLAMLEKYRSVVISAKERLGIRKEQYIFFGATDENFSECKAALEKRYVCGIKVYPKSKKGKTVTTGTIGVIEDTTIAHLLNLSEYSGKPVAFHCDDPEIVAWEGHTIRAELAYVAKIIDIAKDFPRAKVVICHVSCRQSADLIIAAQRAGMLVAIELCPHYLWFDADKANWNSSLDPIFYHCFNRLRSTEHREFLVSLLLDDGPFVFIGSDNAPHTKKEKLEKGYGGLPTNQQMIPVILTLAKQHGISDHRVVDLIYLNAGRFFGIPIFSELGIF